MENKQTYEIIIDGYLFSTFKEFFELLQLLLKDESAEKITPDLKSIPKLLSTRNDYYILVNWENADMSERAFGYDATVSYYEDLMNRCDEEILPVIEQKYKNAREHTGKTLFNLIVDEMTRKDKDYACEVVLVEGMRMADYDFDYHTLSDIYTVEKVDASNEEEVLELYKNNMAYFEQLGKEPDLKMVRHDAKKCPKGADPSKKHFVLFKDPEPVGVADIYLGYPRQDAVWIDLFMIRKDLQGWSYGSEILRDMLDVFAKCGFVWAEAGFLKENKQAEKFWKRNWFVDLHAESEEADGIYHHMIRGLQ